MIGISDPKRFPPPWNGFSYDIRLLKLNAQGDSVGGGWVGDPSTAETLLLDQATSDGGLVLTGDELSPPGTAPRVGVLVKLDSTWAEQWRAYLIGVRGSGFPYSGAYYLRAHELANGHFLVLGFTTFPLGGPRLGAHFLAEIAPPPPGQTFGGEVWRYLLPARRIPFTLAYEPADSTWLVVGNVLDSTATPGRTGRNAWLAKFAGIGPAAPSRACARPPAVPRAGHGPIVGATIAYWADSTTHPGPRHGALIVAEWDFGDGSTATGWQVSHTYAGPLPAGTPVRVRVRNNLSCARDTVLYPFGAPTGVTEPTAAAVQVWPNPSADGRWRVRLPAAATLTVLDVVGRPVWQQAAAPGEQPLDLRALPAGTYALRAQLGGGAVVTRRLLRQ